MPNLNGTPESSPYQGLSEDSIGVSAAGSAERVLEMPRKPTEGVERPCLEECDESFG